MRFQLVQDSHHVAVVRTCRQIYEETHLLPLKHAEYYISSKLNDEEFARWMRFLDQTMQGIVWATLSEEQKAVVPGTGLYKHAGSDTAGQH
jgi:hypothetical protein